MDSGDKEKSCKRESNLLIKYSIREKDVEKARGPGNHSSLKSITGSADQIHDKAPPKQFNEIDKSASNRMGEKDREGCLAPTGVSEPHTVLKIRVRQDSVIDSHKELLSEKIIQDGRLLEKKRARIPSDKTAQTKCHDSFKSELAKLKKETSMLRSDVEMYATKSMKLSDENRVLMDELRKLCEPHELEILEAKNPDKNHQTEDTNVAIKV